MEQLSLETRARILHAQQFAREILFAYLTSGLYGFIISIAFSYATIGSIAVDPVGAVKTLFFWPLSSFTSAQTIFGAHNASIWSYLIAANMIIFITLIASFALKRAQTDFEQEVTEEKEE